MSYYKLGEDLSHDKAETGNSGLGNHGVKLTKGLLDLMIREDSLTVMETTSPLPSTRSRAKQRKTPATHNRHSSPIQNCPEDILYVIFQWYLVSRHKSIRRLLLVCRLWHDIVMNSPTLWAKAQFIAFQSFLDMSEKCPQITYITACVERSQGVPLHVLLNFSRLPSHAEFCKEMESRYPTYKAQGLPLYRSMQSLHYDQRLKQTFCSIFGPDEAYCKHWASLRLSLSESSDTAITLCRKLRNNISNLKSLVLVNMPYDWYEDDHSPAKALNTPSLSEIDLRAYIPVSIFLDSSKSLRHIKLWVDDTLRSIQHLSSFTQLRSLKLECDDTPPKPIPFIIHLPTLTELTLTGGYSILRHISFDLPTLETLIMHTTNVFHSPPTLSPIHICWIRRSTITTKKADTQEAIKRILLMSRRLLSLTVGVKQEKIALKVVSECHGEGSIPLLRHIKLKREDGSIKRIDVGP